MMYVRQSILTGDDVIFASQCDDERKLARREMRCTIFVEPAVEILSYWRDIRFDKKRMCWL